MKPVSGMFQRLPEKSGVCFPVTGPGLDLRKIMPWAGCAFSPQLVGPGVARMMGALLLPAIRAHICLKLCSTDFSPFDIF